MKQAISARGLSFAVGRRRLVDEVDLAAEYGTVLALCGPNGAGKSTLLRLLSGELKPQGGEILIDGVPIHSWTRSRLAAKRALMQQTSRAAVAFTAFEVVDLGAHGIGAGLSDNDRRRLAEAAIAHADAESIAGQSFQTLSGGERQRVSFARALAQLAAGRSIEPSQILFLDEPTASLDIRHQLLLLSHVRDLASTGRAVVIAVLHDLMLASSFADRILILQGGRLAANTANPPSLPREVIEKVFSVSIAGDVCPPTPWRNIAAR